jgi:hypothetical protein
VVQVIEYLPHEHKVLSLNPSTIKEEKKEQGRGGEEEDRDDNKECGTRIRRAPRIL